MKPEAFRLVIAIALFFLYINQVQCYSFCKNIKLENIKCTATTKNNIFTGNKKKTYNGSESYCSFLGIKYGSAERYKEALPYEYQQKEIKVDTDGAVCLQINGKIVTGSEDCLFLSVHTPNVTGSLPVLFYIHGGGFAEGSALSQNQVPDYFMETNKVVMVFIQYRLGALGFVDFNSNNYPANLGLKDQVLALKWVKENIAAFGGNPDQVTIQGESAGAASVSLHMFSPLSKGLFRAAISESGSACCTWAVTPKAWSRERLKLLAHYTGCASDDIPDSLTSPAEKTAECLVEKKAEDIVRATLPFALPYRGMNSFLPVLEKISFKNTFLTSIPWTKPSHLVPWISGINSNEAGLLIKIMGTMKTFSNMKEFNVNIPKALYFDYSTLHPNEVASVIEEHYNFTTPVSLQDMVGVTQAVSDGTFSYPNYLCHRLHQGTPSYNYYFNYVDSKNQNRPLKGVYHSEELQYLFPKGNKNIRVNGTEEDIEVSRKMVDLWVSFVETGVPGIAQFEWQQYNSSEHQVLVVDGSGGFNMGLDPNLYNNFFWDIIPFRDLMP